jgi:hypothetical protein
MSYAIALDSWVIIVGIKVIMSPNNAEIFTPDLNVLEELPIDADQSYIAIEFSSQDKADEWLLDAYEADPADIENRVFNLPGYYA